MMLRLFSPRCLPPESGAPCASLSEKPLPPWSFNGSPL
eukprot:CAMPEP_0119466872 /NCGR_PEP_ID=MMETSP1344-20130328/1328_1 /TAXON_ID=236787 /ORGANISM="Florenciella parvula, Strain CCMP2471" /LENGTH=37 /DNA_ID= /DNA_START= /DNA_END= /DNA_ORIENTATION=